MCRLVVEDVLWHLLFANGLSSPRRYGEGVELFSEHQQEVDRPGFGERVSAFLSVANHHDVVEIEGRLLLRTFTVEALDLVAHGELIPESFCSLLPADLAGIERVQKGNILELSLFLRRLLFVESVFFTAKSLFFIAISFFS